MVKVASALIKKSAPRCQIDVADWSGGRCALALGGVENEAEKTGQTQEEKHERPGV